MPKNSLNDLNDSNNLDNIVDSTGITKNQLPSSLKSIPTIIDKVLLNKQSNKSCALFNSCANSLHNAYNKYNNGKEIIVLGEELVEIAKNIKLIVMADSKLSFYEDPVIASKIRENNVNDYYNDIFEVEKLKSKSLEDILFGLNMESRIIISSLIEAGCLLKWEQIEFFGKELIYIGTKINFINAYISLNNSNNNDKDKT